MVGLMGNAKRIALPEAGVTLTEVVWTEPALMHLDAIEALIEGRSPTGGVWHWPPHLLPLQCALQSFGRFRFVQLGNVYRPSVK
jgi:hypothetical protein